LKGALGKLWLPALLVAICAWLALEKAGLGDYRIDAGTAVDALARGDLSTYFSWHPVMGPLGTLYQTPWSLLGGSEMGRYQWASFGCLLALAGLGTYLAAGPRRRGGATPARTAIAVLCVLNPLTVGALAVGHPEELLTTALALGAIVAACERRTWTAAVLLGLAVATKQWAVIAIFPVLMVLPARRVRTAAVAAGVVAVLNLPYALADPGALMSTQSGAAHGGRIPSIWSFWYAASTSGTRHLAGLGSTTVHEVPTLMQPLTHPLIAVLTLAVPLALWAWRGRWQIDPGDAIALFALVALLRCLLDPNDNLYYHASLLISLIAWDAVAPTGRLPLRSLAGTALALLFWNWSHHLGDLAAFNAAYLVVMVGAAVLIAAPLSRGGRSARTRGGRPPSRSPAPGRGGGRAAYRFARGAGGHAPLAARATRASRRGDLPRPRRASGWR
jgi:hypothetical protein